MQASTKRKTSFKGDVLRLMTGTAGAHAVTVLAAPLLSRIFSPATFGDAAMFASVTGILAVAICLRYEMAIVLAKSERAAVNILGLSVLTCSLLSITLLPTALLFGEELAHLLNEPTFAAFLYYVPPMVFLMGIFNSLNYWNIRTKGYTRISVSRVAGSFANTGTSLTMGFLGRNTSNSLIGASIAAQAISTSLLGAQIWHDHKRSFLSSITKKRLWYTARKYHRFPLYSSWSSLINTCSWMLPALILNAFFSSTVVGFYALGLRMLQMPLNMVSGSLSQVFFQRAKEAHDKGELNRITRDMFCRLLTIGTLPCLLLTILGQDIFSLVFGDQWNEAGIYAQILAPWALIWFISSPLSTVYVILEKQHLEPIIQLSIFASRTGMLLLGGFLGGPRLAILLSAIGGTVAYLYLLHVIFSITNIPLQEIFRTIRIIALRCGVALTPIVLLVLTQTPRIYVVSVASLCLCLYYYCVFGRSRFGIRETHPTDARQDQGEEGVLKSKLRVPEQS